MGMDMGANSYLSVYMGDPIRLFLCREYGLEVYPLSSLVPSEAMKLSLYLKKQGE
jgi:hypothetical protein